MIKTGSLIINADDWGQDQFTTDRIRSCIDKGTVTSVSAMVFMKDSERAAGLSRELPVEAGLHLNFTSPFSTANCPAKLIEHQQQTSKYLLRSRFARVFFHPGLAQSFEYLVQAQIDEFRRIYGSDPVKFDGEHHMHVCANVLLPRLIPKGSIVRRSFTFRRGEKALLNRFYRRTVDYVLASRYRLADFFFHLQPIEQGRLDRIFSAAKHHIVEIETHPAICEEYRYLKNGKLSQSLAGARLALPSTIIRNHDEKGQ